MISFMQDTYWIVCSGQQTRGPGMKSSIKKLAADKYDVVSFLDFLFFIFFIHSPFQSIGQEKLTDPLTIPWAKECGPDLWSNSVSHGGVEDLVDPPLAP